MSTLPDVDRVGFHVEQVSDLGRTDQVPSKRTKLLAVLVRHACRLGAVRYAAVWIQGTTRRRPIEALTVGDLLH